MSYEPPMNDDVFDEDEKYCDDCGEPMSEDTCGEPDRMWGDD